MDSLRNIVIRANKCRKKVESCIRLAEAVPCWGRRYSPRQFVATPPPNLALLSTRFATIGVTSYGALGHVPPLELGHVKKFGSFYDNNKH